MAAPLLLPAHADILEFSVMYTRSVKKKAKDWHDGYLKWHTFNYRAILYDDQRKTVANEFFPNRTICANSDFEFSSAIVQVGNQLDTLQANLENIYRSPQLSRRTDHVHAQAHQGGGVVNTRNPSTPAISRSGPNRIYPGSASKPAALLTSSAHANLSLRRNIETSTPLRTVPLRRSIGMVRPQRSTGSPQNSICPSSRPPLPLLSRQQDTQLSGWLAREDQIAADASIISKNTSNEVSTHRKSHAADQRRDKPKHRTKRSKVAITPALNTGDTEPEQTNNPVRRTEQHLSLTAIEPIPSMPDETDTNLVNLDNSVIQKAPLLDPLRIVPKRKSRTILAIARKCPSPAGTLEVPPPQIGSRLSSGTAQTPLPDRSPLLVIDEAIYDVDAAKWVVENNDPTIPEPYHTAISNKVTDDQPHYSTTISINSSPIDETALSTTRSNSTDLQNDNAIDDCLGASPAMSADFDDAAVSLQNSAADRPISIADTQSVRVHRSMERKGEELDEDGFLVQAPRVVRKPLPARSAAKKRKARDTTGLIEQFRVTDNETQSCLDHLFTDSPPHLPKTPTIAASNLFVPDGTQSSQDSDSSTGPGMYTQLRARAAKEIANHSSIGRIGPAAKNKVLPPKLKLKNTNKKVPQYDSTREKSRQIPTKSMSGIVNGEKFEPRHSLPKNVCSPEDDILPATPAEIQTDDLDAMFSDKNQDRIHVSEPPSLSISSETVESVDCSGSRQVLQNQSNSSFHDITKEEYKLATQLNQRAPDFMTAKSYNSGAILRLDKPLPSVGLSMRDLSNLDLSTQLSNDA